MLKYWRIWLLIVVVLGAMLAIGFKTYPYGRTGVQIAFVYDSSPARGTLQSGMIITDLNGQQITDVNDWTGKTANLKGPVTLTANGRQYSFNVSDSIGVDVTNIDRTNLDLGLDLKGGTRIVLKPEGNATSETISQIVSILQTRANIYGLKEMKFLSVRDPGGDYYIQVEAAGIGRDIIENLLSRQGKFEAKIVKPVDLENNRGTIRLGGESFGVVADNETITVNNQAIMPNQTFVLKNIDFQYLNRTGSRLIFQATAYKGDDIEIIYTDPQRSAVVPQSNGYLFYFVVLVSQEGASRFSDITTGIPKIFDINSGEEYLDSAIRLFIDDQLVSELRISGSLAGQIYTTPQIQGFRPTFEEAAQEKLSLQTILRSGALPLTLQTASIDIISPTLGSGFITTAVYSAVLAMIVISAMVFIRYRKIRVALPIIFISISEIIIILGIAATNDSLIWASVLVINIFLIALAWWKQKDVDIYVWTGAILIPLLGIMSWTIDLPAIGGVIAAIGTGVNDQIIIADEALQIRERKIYTMKEKIKRAFFIIFGAASTVIAAMVPLMFLGIGLVRGFAITTIVGVLVGVLITRPAYAKIIEATTKE